MIALVQQPPLRAYGAAEEKGDDYEGEWVHPDGPWLDEYGVALNTLVGKGMV